MSPEQISARLRFENAMEATIDEGQSALEYRLVSDLMRQIIASA